MTELEKISHDTMVFMRGKYRLDEIGDGKDELKFKQGKSTILTVYTHDDRYSFLVIFGKKERELFESVRETFSPWVQNVYDSSKTYHDGKWMLFDVTALEQFDEVKRLVMIKKKPNRKPFPKDGAYYSMCGQRCDLCIHYNGMSEERRTEISPLLTRFWDIDDWSMRCSGCFEPDCHAADGSCEPRQCAKSKCVSGCKECKEYPCINAGVADVTAKIHTGTVTADEVTWAILPYVAEQYE